jgi:FtsH-binding integral membrane protein
MGMSRATNFEFFDQSEAVQSRADARVTFLQRTYLHLAGAVLAFVGLEAVLLSQGWDIAFLNMLAGSRYSWLIVLAAFIGVSWLAQSWANSDVSKGMQYLGLGLYVVAEAIIFLPLLGIANHFFGHEYVIAKAAIMTLTVFAGLTIGVLMTGHDFSFLRTALWAGSFGLLGLIVASIFFPMGSGLGLIICFAGVALACISILYYTSTVLHHYPTDKYVGAALLLFASVALLFWYILQLVMSFSGRD